MSYVPIDEDEDEVVVFRPARSVWPALQALAALESPSDEDRIRALLAKDAELRTALTDTLSGLKDTIGTGSGISFSATVTSPGRWDVVAGVAWRRGNRFEVEAAVTASGTIGGPTNFGAKVTGVWRL